MPRKPLVAVGIDLGSTWVRCVMTSVENRSLRLLGCGSARSEGWVKGRISDQRAVTQNIKRALRNAEQTAGALAESAVVGIGGPTVRGANSRGSVDLGRAREIDQRDVNRAVDRATLVRLAEDRMVLQVFPQDFVVDGYPGHRDPRGMIASKLEANVHMITASIQEHERVVGAVNEAGLSVEETVCEALAACHAAVLPEERRAGLALLNVGGQSTDLVVYYGDSLLLASSVPVSGDHFSRDLARGLCTSYEDAEEIKEEFGCAMVGLTRGDNLVEIPSPEDREPREALRGLINQVLEARAEELFRYIYAELQRVGMERSLMNGVVLSGGGAHLMGLCDIAEQSLNCQARKGYPIGIQDWPEELEDPAWNTAAGLAMYAGRLKLQMEIERRRAGLLERIFQ